MCGGREFDDWESLCQTLNSHYINRSGIEMVIIEGEAKGADFLARVWAKWRHLPFEPYPADWKKHGYAAGGIRNQQMLDEGKPDIVYAFPGGSGTADMVRRAKEAGVEVVEIKDFSN